MFDKLFKKRDSQKYLQMDLGLIRNEVKKTYDQTPQFFPARIILAEIMVDLDYLRDEDLTDFEIRHIYLLLSSSKKVSYDKLHAAKTMLGGIRGRIEIEKSRRDVVSASTLTQAEKCDAYILSCLEAACSDPENTGILLVPHDLVDTSEMRFGG